MSNRQVCSKNIIGPSSDKTIRKPVPHITIDCMSTTDSFKLVAEYMKKHTPAAEALYDGMEEWMVSGYVFNRCHIRGLLIILDKEAEFKPVGDWLRGVLKLQPKLALNSLFLTTCVLCALDADATEKLVKEKASEWAKGNKCDMAELASLVALLNREHGWDDLATILRRIHNELCSANDHVRTNVIRVHGALFQQCPSLTKHYVIDKKCETCAKAMNSKTLFEKYMATD